VHPRLCLGVLNDRQQVGDGGHTPMVDQATFDKVQAILHARYVTGEKPQTHIHYLKGDLACARCGGRIGICSPTNRHGVTYDYFYCLNRQKRRSCDQPFVSIATVEKQIEDFWRSVRFPKVDLDALRAALMAKIETELREEQARISREIAEAERLIDDHDLKAERATQFLEDLLTLCDDPYALYLCADAPIRQLLNRAVVTRFWIMDEGLHTAELSPEFIAIQEQMHEFARSQAPSVDVPAPRSEADATAQKPANGEDGPMYLRQVGTIDAAVCSPLSAYLHKITETTNPRRLQQDEGLNLVALVGRQGLEP
jgi:site-specific DNA recombinase